MESNITLTKKQVGSYPKLASELSGVSLDIEQWEKGRAMSDKLLQQSHDIAKKMESVGFSAYDHESDLTLVGLNSRQYSKLPPFRNVTIIPWVARKKRNKSSKELEYFLQKNPNARTWVHTTGKRCTLKELPERLENLHAKFGRVNSQPFMKKFGAKFVFRSTEFGEIAKTDEGLSFHPHCHSVLVLDRKLPSEDWSLLVSKICKYFVHWSYDAGKIKSVKELVKYCVKPSDLEHLNGYELLSIHQITTNKRLVEFLGQLRTQRQKHNKDDIRLVRRKGILSKTKNWNVSKPKLPLWVKPINDESGISPTIVAWVPPVALFSHITEPCFLVQGLGSTDVSTFLDSWEVERMRAEINKHSIKVHTKTLTHHKNKTYTKPQNENRSQTIQKNTRSERIPPPRKFTDSVVCTN